MIQNRDNLDYKNKYHKAKCLSFLLSFTTSFIYFNSGTLYQVVLSNLNQTLQIKDYQTLD